MYSVIIVDDELYIRKGLINMIDWQSIGFQVIDEADNGEDALAIIRTKNPDLVITDIRMPDLDGIGLIQAASVESKETIFIIISGHNDFIYAQQAMRFGVMDYVLKPIDEDEIIQVLIKIRDKLNSKIKLRQLRSTEMGEKLIELLIRGELTESELKSWDLPWTGTGVAAKAFTYIFVEWNNLILPWSIHSMPPKDLLAKGIRDSVRQVASLQSEPLMFVHRSTYGIIVPDLYLTSCRGSMNTFLESLLELLHERFPLEFRIYAGKSISSLVQLKDSYLTAKDALQYKFIKYRQKIIQYSDVSEIPLHYYSLEDSIFNRLIEAVEENDREALMIALDRMFSEFQDKLCAPEAMKSAILQYVQRIIRTIRSMEGDERELASLDVVTGWHDHNITLEELRRIVETFTQEAATLVNQLNRSGKGSINRIRRYIDENFHRNISLKGIANQFYMNSAYLGQLFKKNYGVYFNEYVLQLRIKAAKELLRQTDMRNYEIAEKIGFNNVDYFVSQFEKLEQMTPKEYRNRMNER